jgi:polysaccharide biosynthesis/export protein
VKGASERRVRVRIDTGADRVRHGCAAALLLAALLPGCGGRSLSPPPADPDPMDRAEYVIGATDVLKIVVWRNEELGAEVPVRPDGKISLPLLDDVDAAGLTPMQLRDVLAKRLAEYIPNPEVSVIVTDVKSYKVSVMGEVAHPGRVELKSWTTVLDILALSGGFTQFAARSKIVILRPNGKGMERIPFNYNKVVSSGGEQENVYLQPGDIVLVP